MPFKSKAQQRFMFAAQERGELPKGTAEKWAEHTPNIKGLPAKVGKRKTRGKRGGKLKEEMNFDELAELILNEGYNDEVEPSAEGNPEPAKENINQK